MHFSDGRKGRLRVPNAAKVARDVLKEPLSCGEQAS
jgi:predicted small lipoprotein YifL